MHKRLKSQPLVLTVLMLFLLGSTLCYEVDTGWGSQDRLAVRVVPFFVDGDFPEPKPLRPVIRERWSLFGLRYSWRQMLFVNYGSSPPEERCQPRD